MLKAEQNALIQEANKQLLTIRREELEYFVSVFSDFGTLAALIAGFTVSIVTQVDTLNADINVFWKWLFWIASILTMICTLHVVLTTTFINIFGPGLALRGPAGSMVRAVEGMVKEKDSIFLAFFLSIVLFQLANLACCFVVMNTNAAWVSMVIFLFGFWYWYKYCIRIYNRFKLEDTGFAWNDDNNKNKKSSGITRIFSTDPSYDDKNKENDNNSSGRNQYAPKRRTIVQKLLGTNRTNKDLTTPLVEENNSSNIFNQNNYMEGYLTKKGDNNGVMFSDVWTRRYFVLQDKNLYYYKTREDFQFDPNKSIKNRPIDLHGYSVSTFVGDSNELHLHLVPIEEDDDRRIWEFRVDTDSELDAWVSAFIKAGVQKSVSNPSTRS